MPISMISYFVKYSPRIVCNYTCIQVQIRRGLSKGNREAQNPSQTELPQRRENEGARTQRENQKY